MSGNTIGEAARRNGHSPSARRFRYAENHVAEPSAVTGQRRAAADRLSGELIDGPCGPDCWPPRWSLT